MRAQWGIAAGDNLALIGSWVTSPEGAEVIEALGDLQYDPGLLPAALVAARKWRGAQGISTATSGKVSTMAGTRDEQLSDTLKQLTKEQDTAMRDGDSAKAQQLDVQIMRIAAAISGNEPIVGGFGQGGHRTA